MYQKFSKRQPKASPAPLHQSSVKKEEANHNCRPNQSSVTGRCIERWKHLCCNTHGQNQASRAWSTQQYSPFVLIYTRRADKRRSLFHQLSSNFREIHHICHLLSSETMRSSTSCHQESSDNSPSPRYSHRFHKLPSGREDGAWFSDFLVCNHNAVLWVCNSFNVVSS